MEMAPSQMRPCRQVSPFVGLLPNDEQPMGQARWFLSVQHFCLSPYTNAHLTVALSWIYGSWQLVDSLDISSAPSESSPRCCGGVRELIGEQQGMGTCASSSAASFLLLIDYSLSSGSWVSTSQVFRGNSHSSALV